MNTLKIQRIAAILFAFLSVIHPALANEAEAAMAGEPREETVFEQEAHETAPVVIDGRVLFHLRGVSSFPAKARAKIVRERIVTLAKNPNVDENQLALEDDAGEETVWISLGKTRVMGLVDADAAVEGLDSRHLLASLHLKKIRTAITTYREERSADSLRSQAMLAAVATAIFLFSVLVIGFLFRLFSKVVERNYLHRVHNIEIQAFKVIQAEQIRNVVTALLNTMRFLAYLFVLAVFLDSTLSLFPWTREFSTVLFTLVFEPLEAFGLSTIAALPDIIFLVVLFFVMRWVMRMTHLFFDSVGKGLVQLNGFEQEWAMPTYRIVRMVLLVFGLVLAYPHIPGSSSDAFKGLSIFMAVLASVGSPAIVANIFAGYSLTYRRAFKLGDRIKVDDVIGDVMEMRLMVTHLRTPKNEEVIIPNSELLNSTVINYSSLARKGGLILHTAVGIGYEVPWRQVEAMLLEAARRTPDLLTEPKPFVLQTALGDFAVTYELNVLSDKPLQMPATYSALHRNIQDVFNEYGVQIMTPNYENDPEQPKIVPKDQWYTAPAAPDEPA